MPTSPTPPTPPPPPPPGPHPPYLSSGSYGVPRQRVGTEACELCGARPAAWVTVRGHQGIVVMMRFLKREGSFCRDCGLAVYRRMSADTLWQGWWSPLSVIWTPITLLLNLEARGRLLDLPAPYGGRRAPEDPGKRLLLRWPALLVLVPSAVGLAAVTVLFVLGLFAGGAGEGTAGSTKLSPGECAVNRAQWPEQRLEAVGCGSPDAEYTVEKAAPECAPGAYVAQPRFSADGGTAYCLAPHK